MFESSGSVVLLCRDLMATSIVSGAASQADLILRTVTQGAQLTDSTGPDDLILIDLSTPGLDLKAVAVRLTGDQKQRAVVYGPHVHTSQFEAARSAGFATVIPRGQFLAEAAARLKQFADGSAAQSPDE